MQAADNIVVGLSKLGLYLRNEERRHAGPAGLSPTQAQILAHLLRRGPARISALAEALGVTQPTISEAIAALLRKGHISRRPDPTDARAVVVALTTGGRRLALATALWPDALLAAVEALDAAEQTVLLKALTKMIRALQVAGAIPLARLCATCRFFQPHRHSDPIAPHHCAFVDAAFGDGALRLDCDDHAAAAPTEAEALWQAFIGGRPFSTDAPPAATSGAP